jgi:hypothetical protein
MLREEGVRQGQEDRRWFSDEELDLIVWFDGDGGVRAFQLYYNLSSEERALVWSREGGYRHHRVDSGEESPLRNRTPILLADGPFSAGQVITRFQVAAADLETGLRAFIFEKLRGGSL